MWLSFTCRPNRLVSSCTEALERHFKEGGSFRWQELRRDEFVNHYQNVHSEIQEGLDGWLLERCPLHIIGCPFTLKKLYPKKTVIILGVSRSS